MDSHIIPKAFHRDMKGDSTNAPVIIGTKPNSYPKKSPGGIYEEAMLCRPCEERFGPWDDYGAQCLIQNFDTDAMALDFGGNEVIAYGATTWDERQLRMFALSLLWRTAVTRNEMFKYVQLGPHLQRLTERILEADPGSPEEFSVMLVRWSVPPDYEPFRKTQMSPYCVKLLGVNEVKMFMGGFVIHVKVDQRPYPRPFDQILLRPNRPAYLFKRELEGSKDIVAMQPAIEQFVRLASQRREKR